VSAFGWVGQGIEGGRKEGENRETRMRKSDCRVSIVASSNQKDNTEKAKPKPKKQEKKENRHSEEVGMPSFV